MNKKLLIYILFSMMGATAFGQVVADFYGLPVTLCSQPYEVSFYNQSQNDTSILWDFGDGNTSSFFQPNHLYMSPGTYTVTLIAYGVGGNDTLVRTNYVTINTTPTDPVLNQVADTVSCGGSASFIATMSNNLIWFDDNGNVIEKGGSLNFPSVTNSGTYFVRREVESSPVFEGPQDPDSVGTTGAYFNQNQGLQFDALADIRIKSVLVDAGSPGQRTFTLEDTFGIPLQTIDIFIPQGKSRIELNLEVVPGSYVLRGNGVDLYRNNNTNSGGVAYPFNVSGLVSINRSTAGNALNFYYFFYDWEVVSFCKSNDVQVDVVSNPIDAPVVTQDTFVANCGMGADLTATSMNDIYWYDIGGSEVARGDTLKLGFAGGTSSFFPRSVAASGMLSAGPANGAAIGGGTFFRSPDDTYLYFRVYSQMTIVSVFVAANIAGTRTIEILDDNGVAVYADNIMLPAGTSRMNLGVELAPGDYLIGGNDLGLFKNDTGTPAYPYSIPGVVSITGSSTGSDTYNYFYDWEVTTACFSDADTTVLDVLPPAAPTTNVDSITVNCEGNAVFVANTDVTWYDASNGIVAVNDSLSLTGVTSDVTYFARVVEEGTSQFMDPVDGASVGGGGFHGNGFGAFLVFNVQSSIRLVSVLVDAGSAGDRDIQLQDANGNVLQIVTVNIPAGPSRVTLNLDIEPGSYRLGGAQMDLFRNNTGVPYPYTLPGLVTITGSSAGNSSNFYYYFYNWEVVSLCQSEAVPVKVGVLPLAAPTIQTDDTVCYEGNAIFQATSSGASWYDPNGMFIGSGANLLTPPLTVSGTYSVVGESMEPLQKVGPVDNSIGGGGYFGGNQGLEFTVFAPMRLNSAWVDADTAGVRDFTLEDGGGNVLQTISIFIPAGQSRIGLGLTLQPGDYVLGGANTGLFRNNQGPNYPYDISGLVSITSSTAGGNFYYFLYDWEVQSLPCTSDPVNFDVTVLPPVNASFTLSQMNHVISFANSTPGAVSWNWDFGDGGSSTQQFPNHTYFAFGSFAVTLTVSNGRCEGSFTDTVVITTGVGIEDLLAADGFQVYPNPGKGQFVIEAQTLATHEIAVAIYDFTGRQVYAIAPENAMHVKKEVDLGNLPAGNYWIRLKIDGAHIAKQYLKVE